MVNKDCLSGYVNLFSDRKGNPSITYSNSENFQVAHKVFDELQQSLKLSDLQQVFTEISLIEIIRVVDLGPFEHTTVSSSQ